MPPDIWKIKQAKDGVRCVNLTGEYQLWGEVAPQSPKTYRGVPFSLYAITGGPYMPDSDLKKITQVGVEHQDDNEITFMFFTSEGILTQQNFYPSEDLQILCTADSVTLIQKSLQTKGEATTGTADITDTYFLSDDGALIVHSVTRWVSTIFFLIKISQEEEYWVKFKAKKR